MKLVFCMLLAVAGCEEGEGQEPGASGTSAGSEGGQEAPVVKTCDEDELPDRKWLEIEDEVLRKVNEVRARGASCGSRGSFGPAPALKLDVKLRCAARRHSRDMAERNYFDHDNLDGEDPMDRIRKTGYTGGLVGENIAAGQSSVGVVMDGWLKSEGHCANIMKKGYTELGVGYVYKSGSKYKHYWTQNFGASK